MNEQAKKQIAASLSKLLREAKYNHHQGTTGWTDQNSAAKAQKINAAGRIQRLYQAYFPEDFLKFKMHWKWLPKCFCKGGSSAQTMRKCWAEVCADMQTKKNELIGGEKPKVHIR